MTMNEFLDRYIAGGPGSWYYCLDFSDGSEISGGQFFDKQSARKKLLADIVEMLDATEGNAVVDTKAATRS